MVHCNNIDIHHPQNAKIVIAELTKVLDKCKSNFENIIILRDFNVEPLLW